MTGINLGTDYSNAKKGAQSNADWSGQTKWIHKFNGVWWQSEREPLLANPKAEAIKPKYDHPTIEYAASLRRAFVENRMKSIGIDSKHQKFLLSCAQWGQDQGYLTDYEDTGSDEQQYTCWTFKLTPAGKEYFGVKD